jgi:hypothetical protein
MMLPRLTFAPVMLQTFDITLPGNREAQSAARASKVK